MDEREPLPSETPVEELSWRELEVLAQLAERLTNLEIAAHGHCPSYERSLMTSPLKKLVLRDGR